jgi:hypothetical protein
MFTTAHRITPTRPWPLVIQLVVVAIVWFLYPRFIYILLTLVHDECGESILWHHFILSFSNCIPFISSGVFDLQPVAPMEHDQLPCSLIGVL